MGHQGQTTTDHQTIRNWAEARGGKPAAVRSTGSGDDPGILRIDFPDVGAGEDQLEEISWDEFFEKFDEKELQFLYQDQVQSGQVSRFHKFIRRDS